MNPTTLPVMRHSHGRTFVVASGVLAALGVLQFSLLGWAFVSRTKGAAKMAKADVQAATTVAADWHETPETAAEKPPQHLDLQQVLAAPTPGAETRPVPTLPMALPRPTPVPETQEVTIPEARVSELVEQAKALRDRGDNGSSLIRLREAQVLSPRNPQVIAELAATFESMGQVDKAMEYWRRVYEMGDRAGVYYNAAMAKVNPAPTSAATAQETPDANAEVAGIQPGMTLGILDVQKDEIQPAPATASGKTAPNLARHFVMHLPIKARPGVPVNANDVFIQVLFFDLLPDASVEQTKAEVQYRWATAPVDWRDASIEVLDVEFSLPKAKKETEQRQYFGYVASVYYKGDLQDWRADPVKLRDMSPPATTVDAAAAGQ